MMAAAWSCGVARGGAIDCVVAASGAISPRYASTSLLRVGSVHLDDADAHQQGGQGGPVEELYLFFLMISY
jgi:hypothetical protein